MKKIHLIFLLGITVHVHSAAQDSTWYVINPGQVIGEVLTPEIVYRYPQFTKGKVYFVGGGRAEAKLNYDRFREDILFIDAKGDTLSIAEPSTVRLISILTDSFYYSNTYFELIHNYGSVKMAVHEKLSLKDVQKIGAFGQKNRGVSIDALVKYMDQLSSINLVANDELKFKEDELYYLAKKENFFFPANKKNILKEFSELKNVLQEYFSKNDLSFEKKEDIMKLCEFIQSQKSGQ